MRRAGHVVLITIAAFVLFERLGYIPQVALGRHMFAEQNASMITPKTANFAVLWWALAAAVPLLTRGITTVVFRAAMHQQLKEANLARDAYRAFILALAGFSFTGMAALAVLDSSVQRKFSLAILYLVVSFLSFVAALNWQIYKQVRWQHELAGALIEVAILSMLLSVVAIVCVSAFPIGIKWAIGATAVVIWASDHIARLVFDVRFFKEVTRDN